MYTSCGKDGIVDKKIGKRGVILARRDNSLFIRTIYEQIVKKVFDKVDRDNVLYFILEEINKLCSSSLSIKNFVITKSVGDTAGFNEKTKESSFVEPFTDEKGRVKGKLGNYTVPLLSEDHKEREEQLKKKEALTAKEFYEKCLPAQVQLAEKMRRRGGRVENGSRIEYVIVAHNNGTKAKQYEKIESLEYFQNHANILKIDFMYYLEALINPVDQILDVVYGNEDNRYRYKFKLGFIDEQFNFRCKVRTKVIEEIKSLNKPRLVFID